VLLVTPLASRPQAVTRIQPQAHAAVCPTVIGRRAEPQIMGALARWLAGTIRTLLQHAIITACQDIGPSGSLMKPSPPRCALPGRPGTIRFQPPAYLAGTAGWDA